MRDIYFYRNNFIFVNLDDLKYVENDYPVKLIDSFLAEKDDFKRIYSSIKKVKKLKTFIMKVFYILQMLYYVYKDKWLFLNLHI